MLSGGSTVSVSRFSSLCTVIVQTVPAGRFAVGVSVKDVAGDEVCENAFEVPVGHSIEKAFDVALTDSLKVIWMTVSRATSVAPSAGLVVLTLGAASCVVNENEWLAAGWSGGSPVSVSLMFAATAVTVQFAALGRSESGSSVIELVPEPLTWNVCVLLSHEIVNELEVTSTASLKFTVMFAEGSTSVALSAGVVVVTAGAESVVNEKLKSAAMLSGGSTESTS